VGETADIIGPTKRFVVLKFRRERARNRVMIGARASAPGWPIVLKLKLSAVIVSGSTRASVTRSEV
jgi:hypothetical protein